MTSANATKTRLILVFSSLIYFFSLSSTAQDDDFDPLELLYGDEETVSIATGSSKPLHLAPSVASVITADDIRAMGANNLHEALEAVPGLHVGLTIRYSSSIIIRGISTTFNPQVLILLNGYPLGDIWSGAPAPTFTLPVNNIERIEVIRGPGSAVYGADAFSGVINVITKDLDELSGLTMGGKAGSFDTYNYWLQGGKSLNDLGLGFSLEWTKSDGDSDRIIEQDLQSLLDGGFGTSASLAPFAAATHYKRINARLAASYGRWDISYDILINDKVGIGAGVASAVDPDGFQDNDQRLFELRYSNNELIDGWKIEGRLNHFSIKEKTRFNIFPAGTVLPIGADGNINTVAPVGVVAFPDGFKGNPFLNDETVSLEGVGLYSGMENHQWRFSLGYKDQELEAKETKNFGPGVIDGSVPIIDGTLTDVTGTPNIFFRDRGRKIKFISAQDSWSFLTDWELTLGARYDDYSDFGNTFNPRAALVWQTTYNLTSKFLYGRAFRAPSYSELFAINNPIVLGNPNLKPEEIETYELSFDYRPSYDISLMLNLFSYNIDGLIDFVDRNQNGIAIAENFIDQEGYGFELESSWKVSDKLSLSGNLSWQNSENSDSNEDVADSPGKQLYLGGDWKIFPQHNFSTRINYVSDRERRPNDLRDPVDDYTFVDFVVNKEKNANGWGWVFSIKNIFDKEAFEPSDGDVPTDYRLAGRSFSLELNLDFLD